MPERRLDMNIRVRIEEILSRVVEVEADNNIEAVSKVAKMYANNEIILTADDHIDTTLYIVKENE
jgi:hypothetical protein